MQALKGGGRPDSVSRAGEWKLVWKPAMPKPTPLSKTAASRADALPKTAGVRRNWGPGSRPASTVGPNRLAPMRASSAVSAGSNAGHIGALRTGLSRSSLQSRPASVQGLVAGLSRHDTEVESIATARSAGSGVVAKLRLPSRGAGSEAGSSARSGLSTMSQMSVPSSAMRLSDGKAMDSQRSHSSLASSKFSAYSNLTSVSQQDEILKRIQGLEDALNAERALRLQMQTLIQSQVPSTIPES